jgi:RNA polymerase sigma-70 factor (ECF subfamily)
LHLQKPTQVTHLSYFTTAEKNSAGDADWKPPRRFPVGRSLEFSFSFAIRKIARFDALYLEMGSEMLSPPADPEELVELMTQFQGRLYVYILSLIGEADAANDVLQEANIVLWRESRQYVPGTNFKAWAFRIAHFQCMAHRQRRLRDRIVFSDEVIAALATESKELDASYEQRAAALGRCLEKIQTRSREALRLRYADGVAVKEIAMKMDRTANAVSQLLFRARQWLIECVKRDEEPKGAQ